MSTVQNKSKVSHGGKTGNASQKTGAKGSLHVKGNTPAGNRPVSAFYSSAPIMGLAAPVQTKLTMGAPGDKYEREADRVAGQVMRMPEQSTCPECPDKEKEDMPVTIQAKTSTGRGPIVTPKIEAGVRSLKGGGLPLPISLRHYFEPRFGADFSQVRIHTAPKAAETAKAINARAFTSGADVGFGAGQYSPDTPVGKQLLAHELTHVVQQTSNRPSLLSNNFESGHSSLFVSRQPEHEYDNGDDNDETGLGTDEEQTATGAERFEGEHDLIARREIVKEEIRQAEYDYAMVYAGQDAPLKLLNEYLLDVIRARRELFLLDYYYYNAGFFGLSDYTVEEIIERSERLSYDEEATLLELEGQVEPGQVGLAVQDILLDMPDLFPDTVVGLYNLTEAEFIDQSNNYYVDFLAQTNTLKSKPVNELIHDFVWMIENDFEIRRNVENLSDLTLTLVDSYRPIFLERRVPDSTSLGIDNLKVTLNETRISWHKVLNLNVEENLKFLYPILENYYFATLYAELARQMGLFRLSVEVGYQRLNQVEELPDIRADILRTYSHRAPQVTTPEMISGYETIYQAVEKVLDNWVAGLSWWRKIQEGLGLYDLWGEMSQSLKALFNWRTLVVVVGFVAFVIAMQGVPFANLVLDGILIIIGGLDMLKFIVIFSVFFDKASDATTFMALYRAAQGLKGGGQAAVDLLITLAGLAAKGALNRYVRYSRKTKFKDIDDIADHPVIKYGNRKTRQGFKKAQARSRTFKGWERQLDETSKFLMESSPKLRKALAEHHAIRKMLTFCSSPCVLPTAIDIDDMNRFVKLFSRHRIRMNTKLWHRMREYIYINRHSITRAIDELEKAADRKGIRSKIDDLIIKEAAGGTARRGSGNRWEYVRNSDDAVIREYEMAQYGHHSAKRGSKDFFQSHHGIQDEWAKTRLGDHGYTSREGIGILLRDRRTGSPHQIISARQTARKGGRTTRTYYQERNLLLEDMKAAGVPARTARRLLKKSDAYFGKLYKQMKQSGQLNAIQLRSIFGRWRP
jgi:hypothetical protein